MPKQSGKNTKQRKEKKSEPKKNVVEETKKLLEEEKNKRIQVLADFENYKKRVQNEREELSLLGNAVVFNVLLEVLDDLQRALENMEEKPVGLTMIEGKIKNLLTEQGIEEISITPGDEFDPKKMEAIGTVSVQDEKENNKVVHLERMGYKMKDKDFVIRGARVIVGKKQ